MTKKSFIAVLVSLLALTALQASPADRVDSWVEELSLFGWSGSAATTVQNRQHKSFELDYVNKTKGDFSVVFSSEKAAKASVISISPGKYIDSWPLGKEWALHLALKTNSQMSQQTISIAMIDNNGLTATGKSSNLASDGNWHTVDVKFEKLTTPEGFDFENIALCQVSFAPEKGMKLWFDDIYFHEASSSNVIGVTEKSVEQRIQEHRLTREARIEEAFGKTAKGGFKILLNSHFSRLWMGIDVEKINKELYEIFTTDDMKIRKQYGLDGHWSLFLKQMLIRLYFNFGSTSEIFPGRLEAKTETALLEVIWEQTKNKNDIYLARQSTWWMEGSENHDLNAKVANLLSSQIFMRHPEFADRVYPDKGKGGGQGYWFHQMYAVGAEGDFGPDGRASLKDPSKSYTAEDHYEAWVKYMMEYLAERSKKGFFLEVAASGYLKYTISFINDIYDYSDDPALKAQAKKFLDLIWAEWAQDQLSGIRGGAKTRDHGGAIGTGDAMYQYCQFFLGAAGNAGHAHFAQLLTDYEFPELVWQIALDRESLGCFAYISRKPGEEEGNWPRPKGCERTLCCDTESRFVRYSWVTPDYILGTQMDHPAANHSHLSPSNRSQGMIFSNSPNIKVYPRDVDVSDPEHWKMGKSSFYRSVQHENVLITQQCREYTVINPEWFPSRAKTIYPFGVYFGKKLDKLEEKNGWIFVQQGNAYLAVRVVIGPGPDAGNSDWNGKYKATDGWADLPIEDAYDWDSERTLIKAKDDFCGIIFESARVADYKTLQEFQDDVLDNPIKLLKTVVPGWPILTYTGCGRDAKEIYFNLSNVEMPTVGGEYIDYSYPMTFDSPYLKSEYKSGKVKIQYGGEELDLDFSDKPWWKIW